MVEKSYGHKIELAEDENGHGDRLSALLQALPVGLESLGRVGMVPVVPAGPTIKADRVRLRWCNAQIKIKCIGLDPSNTLTFSGDFTMSTATLSPPSVTRARVDRERGIIPDVKLWRHFQQKGRIYSPAVLKEGMSLYEGVPCFHRPRRT